MNAASWSGCADSACACRRHFDVEYTDSIYRECLSFLARDYFRVELVGAERIPVRAESDPPLIFACNHSGNCFPWDSLMFKQALWPLYRERYGERAPRRDHVRALAAPQLSERRVACLFGIDDWWRRMGAVDVSAESFDLMMRHPWDLIVFPEGIAGIAKGFDRRYRMVRFKRTLARMAVTHRATIVPVHVLNAEYLNPLARTWAPLDRWARKRGIPFIPLGPTTPGWLAFPWVFYATLPARLKFVIGEPIRLQAEPGDGKPERQYRRLTDMVQRRMQDELQRLVAQETSSPYDLGGLAAGAWRARGRIGDWAPAGWARMFVRHARRHSVDARAWPQYLPFLGWRWAWS
jgi:1-acyl-sn-glycerol-3-phosphate acyltransferase